MGELGWLFLTTIRAQDEELLRLQWGGGVLRAQVQPVRELRAEGNVLKPEIIRTFKTSELQEIMKTFRQEPRESVLQWLVRVWDNAVVMAVDGCIEDLAATLMQLEATLAGAKPKAIQAAKGQQGGGQEKGEI
ncbi:unnamed protein product [Caretta caretta]